MNESDVKTWGSLIAMTIIIIFAVSFNAYFDPYVTICQGDTEAYEGLFITVNKASNTQDTATFTAGTDGSDTVTYQDKEIGFYGEIEGVKRYGIRLLSVSAFRKQCAYFYINTDSPTPPQ